MGVCCSKVKKVAYLYEKYVNEDAWLQWDKHEARKYYKVERLLGRGAFSEVRASCSHWTCSDHLPIDYKASTSNITGHQ